MSPMIRLAEDASREPFFLGYHLATLRQEYGQTVEQQAAGLCLDLDGWTFLALCRMPASLEDVEKIARRIGMEPSALGELLQLDLLE